MNLFIERCPPAALRTRFRWNWNLKIWVFEEREKPEYGVLENRRKIS